MAENQERKLDEAERRIIRELIRDPRASDSFVSKKTDIPVMTVNRKRKRLEREGLLRYYTSLNTENSPLGTFNARQLYIIKFKIGITQQVYQSALEKDSQWQHFNTHNINFAYLGEKNGHLALILALSAKHESELVEEFNGTIVPFLRKTLGSDAIEEINTTALTRSVRRLYNYIPAVNIKEGRIDPSWPDENIFVDQ